MFQTLRQESRGDRQFIAETTRAPFEKKSQGKFARVACNLCRGKKVCGPLSPGHAAKVTDGFGQLKCTAEKEGCQRCQEKGLTCVYGPSSPSTRHSTAEAAGSEAALAPPATAQDLVGSVGPGPDGSASETMTDAGPDVFDHDAALFEFLQTDAAFEAPEPPVSDSLFFDTVGMVTPLHATMSLGDAFAQDHAPGALQQTVAHGGTLGATSLSSALPSSNGNSNGSAGISSQCGPSRQNCGCFDLLRTFEAVEIYLVWATRASSPGSRSFRVDEVLSCQKEVLDRCDLRLQCREYPLKSWDAMLLISICDKVLASILKVMAAGESGPAQSPRRPTSSERRQSFLNPDSSPHSVMEQLFLKR